MKFDLTLTITAVIAICALITPLLTSLINNHHSIKIKQIELKARQYDELEIHKRLLLENFIRSVGNALAVNNIANQKQLANDFSVILPYLPKEYTRLFTEFCNAAITSDDITDEQYFKLGNIYHEEIIPAIKSMIDK